MKTRFRTVLSICLVISWIGCVPAISAGETPDILETYFPGNDGDWKTDIPESRGINSVASEEAYKRITSNGRTYSFLVVKDGYLVVEYYADGYDENSIFAFNSCTKSITSAVLGIAMDNGLVGDVTTRIAAYFPELEEDGDKEDITIEHLLTMTAGWDWPEWSTWNYMLAPWVRSENWVDFVLERNQLYSPGTMFAYNTGASQLLSAIIQKAAGIPEDEYAHAQLFDKIGMTSIHWDRDPQGVTLGGFGLYMTSRDAARFGLLYCSQGKWEEEQVVSEQWVNASTQKHANGHRYFSPYGYHWWVDTIGVSGKQIPMFYAMGFGGQYLFILPEINMVAVFASDPGSSANSVIPLSAFKTYVGEALGS